MNLKVYARPSPRGLDAFPNFLLCAPAFLGAMTLACRTVAPVSVPLSTTPSADELAVDKIFAEFHGNDRPGCVVGVAREGRPLLTRAYGLASLDDGTVNTTESIFEAASVSKQFTGAAVVLLAQQGKLSLDDDVRKYLPELPIYDKPITLRRMLTHTSGLRDWGAIEDIAGWPRGTRVYTQRSVLDIVRRQRALNFSPGDQWSYSNSNYNLAAIVVARVSGMSFAEFTRQAIFVPLGMSHTRWRDDYTRVVPGKSTPYSFGKNKAWHVDLPIEDAIGNGGLLTTVGDLLRWNSNFAHPVVGDAAFVSALETPGVLESGRRTRYGFGLFLDKVEGARSFGHSGLTAGYASYLDRFPDHGLSIAILCNAGNAKTGALNHAVAKAFLPRDEKAAAMPPGQACLVPTPSAFGAFAGRYRSERTGSPVMITFDSGAVKLDGTAVDFDGVHMSFCAGVDGTLSNERGARLEAVDAKGEGGGAPQRLRITFGAGGFIELTRIATWKPDTAALLALEGEYASDEADAHFTACVREGKLVLLQGQRVVALDPSHTDVFTSADPYVVAFQRVGAAVKGFDVGTDRLWKLPFARVGAAVCAVTAGAATGEK